MSPKLVAIALPALAIGLCAAGPQPINPSNSRLVILGNSQAQACSDNAFLVAEGKMSASTAVQTCTEALTVEALTPFDTAATYNNRGVVRLGMFDEEHLAIDDFNAAAKVEPGLAESYINRGAVLMREERYADAIVEFDRGIALEPEQPWRAYYNRAAAREAVDDIRGAYADYRKALELKPDWPLPAKELERFQVRASATR